MALIWAEGFEGFGTTNGVAPAGYDLKYSATNRISLTDIQTGRIAGKSWLANTSSLPSWTTKDLGAVTTVIIGFSWKAEILNGTRSILNCLEPSDLVGVDLRVTQGGELAVYNFVTLLGTSLGAGLKTNQWYYIELKAFISNTVGTVEVHVNETQVLNLTGKDTLRGGTAEWRKYKIQGSSVFPHNFSFDDWYVCDDSGSVNNDFLGSVRIDGLLPDASGDQTDWTPSAGSNYAAVDENPHDTDTTYVESSTSTDQDLYNYASVPTTLNVVHGLQINTIVRETDVSDFTLKTLIKTGTTTSVDSAQAIAGTSYETLHRIAELDPDTSSAWTSSGINGAQFGIEVG